jgi:hypothetical protein
MVPALVHLLIRYETSEWKGLLHEVVDRALSSDTSTHIEDHTAYMYNDVSFEHPIFKQHITLKIRMLRDKGLKNLVVKAFQMQLWCEDAVIWMVECEIQDKRSGREWFEMEWEHEPWKGPLAETLRVCMT